MRAATSTFRRGGLGEDFYRSKVVRFWGTLGVAPSGTQVVHPAPTVPPSRTIPAPPAASAAAGTPSIHDQLTGLAKLHADGVLTDDEFAAAKRRILGI